jgi:hypothetical protein
MSIYHRIKNFFFTKENLSILITFLLCISLFREVKFTSFGYSNIINIISELSLFILIILLSLIFIFEKSFSKKRFFYFVFFHLIFFCAILFINLHFNTDTDLDLRYLLKRNFQIIFLFIVFITSLKYKLNIKIITNFLLIYILFLLFFSILQNGINDINFRNISRIHSISYFALTFFGYIYFFSNNFQYLKILFILSILFLFGSKFILFFCIFLISLKYLGKYNNIANSWIFFSLAIILFFSFSTAYPQKIIDHNTKLFNIILDLKDKTYLFVNDVNSLKKNKYLILKYEEDENRNIRKFKSFIYSIYISINSRFVLSCYYLNDFINNKILTNDKLKINLNTVSLSWDANARTKTIIKLKEIGLNNYLDNCNNKSLGIYHCLLLLNETIWDDDINFLLSLPELKLIEFSGLNLNYGFKKDFFSSHNSLISFIYNFSYLAIIYIVITIFLIQNKILKKKITEKKILFLIFIITISLFEDYLFYNAYQVSIITFMTIGNIFSSEDNKIIL